MYRANCWDYNRTKLLTTNCQEYAIAHHVFSTNHRIKWDHFEILGTGRKKCWNYRLWIVVSGQCMVSGQWSRKSDFNHCNCWAGWNSFQRRYRIDIRAKEREFQTSVPCATFIKMKTHFQFIWLTGTLTHRKWSETRYLRDKQCKKNLQVKVQEIASWNLSDGWRRNHTITETTTRTANLLIFTIHPKGKNWKFEIWSWITCRQKTNVQCVNIQVKFINSCGPLR